MPFVFIVLGLLFLIVAIRGTEKDFFALLKSEFVGNNSFIPWASAIVILGLIGFAKPVRPITDSLIGLIVLAMLLANHGGVFSQFNQAIRSPVAPTADPATSFTPAGAALAAGSTLSAPTANADAASLADGQPLGEPAAPAAPATDTRSWWQKLFLPAPAY